MAWIFIDALKTDRKNIAQMRSEVASYEASRRRRSRSSDVSRNSDDVNFGKSKRQLDHEWYGHHSELEWRDREQAQAWGMDADTYVSNWLES